MTDPNKQLFQIYFAGASLAFGLPFLLIELISLLISYTSYSGYSEIYGMFYVITNILGGALGGALVAKKIQTDVIRTGAIVGLMAYLLHQVVYFIFFGMGVLGDLYTLFSLVGGCILGSYSMRQTKKGKKEEPETNSAS